MSLNNIKFKYNPADEHPEGYTYIKEAGINLN